MGKGLTVLMLQGLGMGKGYTHTYMLGGVGSSYPYLPPTRPRTYSAAQRMI